MRVFPLATGAQPFSAVFHFVAQAVQPGTSGGGGGGGAPTTVDYLVGTADATLTNEIVVGATPGGELGGTWASPSVDATHSGSSHAGVQAAAEATAAAALAAHVAADVIDGDTAGGVLSGTYPNPGFAADMATQAELNAHESDTTSVHGITDTSTLYRASGTDVALADGGTGASLADPGADRIMFWDDSAGAVTWLEAGDNLTITDATIDAAAGGASGPDFSSTFMLMGG